MKEIFKTFILKKSQQTTIKKENYPVCKELEHFMILRLLIKHHLDFLSLKEGCTCSSESLSETPKTEFLTIRPICFC